MDSWSNWSRVLVVVVAALISLPYNLLVPKPAVAPDQRVGRTVVCEMGIVLALQFGNDSIREYFAEFNAPLIERVDVPDRPLSKHTVFVERDQPPQRLGSQALGKNGIGRSIAGERAMWRQPGRCSFGLDRTSTRLNSSHIPLSR